MALYVLSTGVRVIYFEISFVYLIPSYFVATCILLGMKQVTGEFIRPYGCATETTASPTPG